MKRLNCYIYIRVSTSIQVEGFSLDAQREKLRKYAVLKLPYQILQAGVGAVASMILCRKFKLADLFNKEIFNA